jgi:hypothetical protein
VTSHAPAGAITPDGKLTYSPAMAAAARRRRGLFGRLRECSGERTVVVDQPPELALPFVWRIENVERCERKADRVTVWPETSWTGTYLIRGRLFGVLPWDGRFRYLLHERGFHSEDAARRRGGLRVTGGFTVEWYPAGCRIWHYERYLLPWPVVPLKPLVTAYVRWTQRRDMRDLATLIASG